MAYVPSGAPDFSSEEILKRAAAARASSPTAASAPSAPPLATPQAPVQPTKPAAPSVAGKVANAAGRLGGAGIALSGGANVAAEGASTADRVGGAATLAQGALTMAKPAAGFSWPVLAAAAPGMVFDHLRGKMDNVPKDEVIRQAQPVPPLVTDIRGPETMKYTAGRLLQRSQTPPAAPAADPMANNEPGTWHPKQPAPNINAATALLNQPIAQPARPNIQVPALLQPPVQRPLGPLPTLEAKPGQSIFTALMNLGRDMGQYRNTAQENKQQLTAFNNAMKAGEFNINTLAKSMQIQTQFEDNERKNLESEIKTRTAEAQRILASGKHTKEQERGLRILAGMEKGKFTPAVVYGEADPVTGQQQKMTVAVRDDGTVVPLQIPGFNAPGQGSAKTVSKADFQNFVKQNGYSDKQAREFFEKQGFKVEG